MKTNEFLLETVILTETKTYKLWESAGRKIVEAELTADQINQLFGNIQQSLTAAGGNRTVLGKGMDAASAVNQAWEDLKTKIQNSGPVQNFDQKVSDALSKIGLGAAEPEFKGNVNKWVQKYRDFAKEHPIAQGAIYATLIALAGISGAGIAGAATLGLLKMADQLIQGKRFSSAAYSGAKTGAMAYGASKVGDYIKGKMGNAPGQNELVGKSPEELDAMTQNLPGASLKVGQELPDGEVISGLNSSNLNSGVTITRPDGSTYSVSRDYAYSLTGQQGINPQLTGPISGSSTTDVDAIRDMPVSRGASSGDMKPGDWNRMGNVPKNPDGSLMTPQQIAAAKDSLRQGAGDVAAGQLRNVASSASTDAAFAVRDAITNGEVRPGALEEIAKAAIEKYGTASGGKLSMQSLESIAAKQVTRFLGDVKNGIPVNPIKESNNLSESEIFTIFSQVILAQQLNEGIWDSIKGAAGKAVDYVKTKGQNLTTKVTADKLLSAWKKAGSPTDSNKVADILRSTGVTDDVINNTYTSMSIPAPGTPDTPKPDETPADAAPAATATATTNAGNSAVPQGGGKVPGQLSQTPNAIRKRQQRAAAKAAKAAAAPTAPAQPAAAPTIPAPTAPAVQAAPAPTAPAPTAPAQPAAATTNTPATAPTPASTSGIGQGIAQAQPNFNKGTVQAPVNKVTSATPAAQAKPNFNKGVTQAPINKITTTANMPAQAQKFNAKPGTQPKKLAVTESKDNDILNLWKRMGKY